MLSLTRLQSKSYIKSKVDALKDNDVVDNMLNIDLNLSCDKVRGDLAEIGVTKFNKQAILEGSVVDSPSDLLSFQNAIIDMKASTGVRAYLILNTLTYKAAEPGTNGNYIKICYINSFGDCSVTLTGTGTLEDPYIITVDIVATVTLDSEVKAAIEAHKIADFLVEVLQNPELDITVPQLESATALANGTGNGWYPCDEVPIEKFNRIKDDYINDPTATYPKFRLLGDRDTGNIIEALPKSITWMLMFYHY